MDYAQVQKSLLNSIIIISKIYFLNIEVNNPKWYTHTSKESIIITGLILKDILTFFKLQKQLLRIDFSFTDLRKLKFRLHWTSWRGGNQEDKLGAFQVLMEKYETKKQASTESPRGQE